MATDPLANAVETFGAPIESLITALGQGLAQAQQAMDQNSIQTQQAIDSNPILSQYGLQATWYQFPTVNMQLKMSLSISQDQPPAASAGPAVGPALALSPGFLHIIAQPISASFQTHFNYDAQAATQIDIAMVPVPPPKTANQVSTPPQLTPAKAQALALASSAPFVTTTDAQGNKIPATIDAAGNALTMIINFNAVARVWYVMQYAPSNTAIPAVVVAVDDQTQSVRLIAAP
jgi:hypothetical protein